MVEKLKLRIAKNSEIICLTIILLIIAAIKFGWHIIAIFPAIIIFVFLLKCDSKNRENMTKCERIVCGKTIKITEGVKIKGINNSDPGQIVCLNCYKIIMNTPTKKAIA